MNDRKNEGESWSTAIGVAVFVANPALGAAYFAGLLAWKGAKAVAPPAWGWASRKVREAAERRRLAAERKLAEQRAKEYRLAEEARIKALPKPLTQEEKLAQASAKHKELIAAIE